jgi:hypothetical protein
MTDFNDFIVAATEASTAVVVPAVVDGSTATRKMTVTDAARQVLDDANAAAMRTTLGAPSAAAPALTGIGTYDSLQTNVVAAGNQTGSYTLAKTADFVTITATGNVTLAAPAAGTAGKVQDIEVRITASGADRVITPSGFTITGAGTAFTVASGTTEIFSVQWTGSAWEWSGNTTAAKIANTPAGNIAATTVQAAINELDTEKAPVAGPGTSQAFTVGSIELGHATDTTIARSGAGAITVEGVQVILSGAALGTPASGTLTNCSGLPASGLVATTATAVGFGTIELGHASDTTIARSAAGVATIEGVRIATLKAVNSVNATGNLVNNTINEFYGSTAAQTLTLPTMADGDSLIVDNTSSVSVTIGRNSQTINGASSDDTLTTGKAVTYYWRASGALRRIGALS